MRKPWKLEYAEAEGGVGIDSRYWTWIGAVRAKKKRQKDQPGVQFWVRRDRAA